MSSASEGAAVGARVRVDGHRPPLREGAFAVRACVGRCTVDMTMTDDGLLAVVGDGVGDPPAVATISPTTAAAVLELADAVDERTVWTTSAWPLAC